MIADHKCKNYMLELQAAIVSDRDRRARALLCNASEYVATSWTRGVLFQACARAPSAPPTWQSFAESSACACCAADFSWASTCHSYTPLHLGSAIAFRAARRQCTFALRAVAAASALMRKDVTLADARRAIPRR